MGELRIDSLAGLLKGGGRGPAVVPGDPDRSLLIKAVGYQDRALQMPPRGRLPAAQTALLTEWIRKGAPWPIEKSAPSRPTRSLFNLQERARHWAFQPIRLQPPPSVRHKSWPQTPIDNFILAKLEAKGLTPAPPADRRTLLRRVTYDLIGLPPTPAEIAAFLADRSPNAYKKVVDRLLASPHYGERWARHWLDLVRYAETDGHEFDFEKANAYRYRDYVIRAFNNDLPYNQFVQEQIAGDLLPNPRRNPADGDESLIGTGFYWLGEGVHSPVDLNVDEDDRVANQIDVFGKTFLGLTVGCARCHDHKFDAIGTRDYYALSGFFKSARYDQAVIDSPARIARKLAALEKVQSQLRPLLATDAARRLQRIAEALPAALLAGRPGAHTATVDAAGAAGQTYWSRYLREVAVHNPTDPLYPFAVLAAAPSPEAFARSRAELTEQMRALMRRAKREADGLTLFEEFRRPDYQGWYVTGEAFGRAPNPTPTLHLDPSGRRGVAVYGSEVVDSGAASTALQGALRSRTFTIEKKHVLYHLAGRDAAVRLVIDGFQRIRAPIYGGLDFSPDGETLRWYEQDASKWIGHRAYIEILDYGNGYAALDRIAFSDGAAPVEGPNPQVVQLLASPGVASLEDLATGCRNLLQSAVRAWSQGSLTASTEPVQLPLINWLLRVGPLDDASTRDADAEHASLAALLETRRNLERSIPEPQRAMATVEGDGFDDRVHFRGDYRTLGERVPRRFLEACLGANQPAVSNGSGRLILAQRLTSASTPLLPRVMVNRIWQHHFGEGIVRTPDDFGIRGDRPTHPELLDYLAATFVRQGWSLKKMHRLMVLSAAYQMASKPMPRAESVDPANRLLHRAPIRRLEAESIRDAILAVSGRLDPTLYGPSVTPYLTPYMEGRGRPAASGPLDGAGRRSIYLGVRRNFLNPMFLAFDFPTPFSTMGRRMVSSVPAQALALMNNPFVVEQAEFWAHRMLKETADPRERIRRMYLSALGRPPSPSESAAALAFVQEQNQRYGGADPAHAWSDLCHILINVKEFIFVN